VLGLDVDDLHVSDPWDDVEPHLQLDVRDRRGRLLGVGAGEVLNVVDVLVVRVSDGLPPVGADLDPLGADAGAERFGFGDRVGLRGCVELDRAYAAVEATDVLVRSASGLRRALVETGDAASTRLDGFS
jgi:hypothetical protein